LTFSFFANSPFFEVEAEDEVEAAVEAATKAAAARRDAAWSSRDLVGESVASTVWAPAAAAALAASRETVLGSGFLGFEERGRLPEGRSVEAVEADGET
jgi:hypothetical protein